MLYLFDIDGTVLWSGGAGARALNRVFLEQHGVDGAMDRVSAGGKTDPIIIGEMFRNALGREPTRGEVDEVLAAYEDALPAELAGSVGFRVLPHVYEVLDELGADEQVTLAIATGNSARGARAKLERAGLEERFLCGGYGCDSHLRSELVATAIRRAEGATDRTWSAAEIVVVGDTPRDIEAARECGVRVVAVATGHPSRAELEASKPDAVIDTLAELLPWHRG